MSEDTQQDDQPDTSLNDALRALRTSGGKITVSAPPEDPALNEALRRLAKDAKGR